MLTQRYFDLDTSIFRQLPVAESRYFEFRFESFNLMNNVVLSVPSCDKTRGSFVSVNSTASTARQLQIAGKFVF